MIFENNLRQAVVADVASEVGVVRPSAIGLQRQCLNVTLMSVWFSGVVCLLA